MSLDVWLTAAEEIRHKCICPICKTEHARTERPILYDWNITHNLGEMARQANIYDVLWRPNEHNYQFAKDIISRLTTGLKELKDKPAFYKQFNSKNGWGVYENLVMFVESYLKACKEYPNAVIDVSR